MPRRLSGYRRGAYSEREQVFASSVYVTAKGRKFASWITDAGRSIGFSTTDLIENPGLVIESIFRDVLGLSSINVDSFNQIADQTNGKRKDWKIARSITGQSDSLAVIEAISSEAAVVVQNDYTNSPSIVALDNYNPTVALGDSNIAEDTNGHPIIRVKQSHVQYIKNEFYLNYRYNYATGNYDKQLFINASTTNISSNTRSDKTYATYTALCAGSQSIYNCVQRWTFDADWIRDDATAESFIKTMADWLALRKWEIETTVHYGVDTLKLEPMDQVLWVQELLPTSRQNVTPENVQAVGHANGGTLANGTYYYVVGGVDLYGETIQSEEVSATVTGSLGTVTGVSGAGFATGGSLANLGDFYYVVVACDATGPIAKSAEYHATTPGPAGNNARVELTWNSFVGAVTYRIYGRATGAQDIYFEVTAPTVDVTDTGVTPDGSGSVPSASACSRVTISWDALPGATSYRVYGRGTGAQDKYFSTSSTSFEDVGDAGTAGTPQALATAFFVTDVIDRGMKGGMLLDISFLECPSIFA